MSKITLTDLANLQNETTAVNAINANNAVLETAFDNTVSRDGTSPNEMNASLDMNSNRVINLPVPVSSGEPVRLGDLEDFDQFQNSVDLAAALATASASASTATTQAGVATTQAGIATTAAAAAAGVASNQELNIFSFLPANEIAAIQNGTSVYDAAPVINSALLTANGRPLHFPKGEYYIPSGVKVIYPQTGGLGPAPVIIGEGWNNTVFRSDRASTQLNNAFTTTNGNYTVRIAWPSHGLAVGDAFILSNLNSHSIGGLDLEGTWRADAIIDANTVDINHWQAASSSVAATGSATPLIHAMVFDTLGGFMFGGKLQGFQIRTMGTPIGSSCLYFRRAYQWVIDEVWANNAVANGITCVVTHGDVVPVDSSNNIDFGTIRISNCGRWGLELAGNQTRVAGVWTGYNELSGTTIKNILIDTCGFNQTAYQYGGAFKWKGQGLIIDYFSCVTCINTGFYVPPGAGQPSGVTFDFFVVENCTGRPVVIEGLDSLVGKTLEVYNGNAPYNASSGLYLNGAVGDIRNINIQSSIFRASSGNSPYTAFLGVAPLTNIRIYTPSMQTAGFPAAGQTLNTGITFLT